MTVIPAASGGTQPREWSVSNRTLVVSADSKRVLAVLNGRDPLLLPPGSVLQLGDPPGELVVTRIRVMVSEGGGCAGGAGDEAVFADAPQVIGHLSRRPERLREARRATGS
jgi:hypothetical protein